MDLAKNMNNVIDYIEENIEGYIDKTTLAQIAMCSNYHLSRMFPFLTGITLSKYIRNRRMSMAGLELSKTNISVIDVSIKYGYDSPTAFTQAFKNVHGIAPSVAKNQGNMLTLYPKLSFTLSLKGDIAMNYRFEKKEAFNITGVKHSIEKVNGDEDFAKITELWSTLDVTIVEKLLPLSNNYFEGLIGASANNQDGCYDYYIGVTSNNVTADNTETISVPSLDWAVFEVRGLMPKSMIEVWKRIFTEWFPNSGYETIDAPCLEIYLDEDITSDDYYCELWIPVQKLE